jgi:DNA-binding MarR family transcriptional regulator
LSQDLTPVVAAYRSIMSTLKRAKVHDLMASVAGVRVDQPDVQVMIHLLDSGEPRRIGAIAQALRVESPHVTRTVAKLERQELVERVRDPDDGRAWRIWLTPRGTEVAQVCLRVNLELFGAAMTDWTPEERADLARLLSKLSKDMSALIAERSDRPTDPQP